MVLACYSLCATSLRNAALHSLSSEESQKYYVKEAKEYAQLGSEILHKLEQSKEYFRLKKYFSLLEKSIAQLQEYDSHLVVREVHLPLVSAVPRKKHERSQHSDFDLFLTPFTRGLMNSSSPKLFAENQSKAIDDATDTINKSRNIVVVTGNELAPTSLSPNEHSPRMRGLWEYKNVMNVEKFNSELLEAEVIDFKEICGLYLAIMNKLSIAGNLSYANQWLTSLQQKGKLKGIVTQNIDLLHESAGLKNVIHLHGVLQHNNQSYKGVGRSVKIYEDDIVFMGEKVAKQVLQKAEEMLDACDCLILFGAKCDVNPLASLVFKTARRLTDKSKDHRVIEISSTKSFLTKQLLATFLYNTKASVDRLSQV
jgi:NAD-dependent deacetylase